MKVLLLDQFSDLGGAQRMLLDVLAAFRDRGWCAAVGTPDGGELPDRVHALGFETLRFDCGPYSSGRKSAADMWRFLTETPRLSRQIRDAVQRFDPDLVYINGPRLLPAAALARFERPVLFHAHIAVAQRLARLLAGISLRLLNATVVGVCRMVADSWRPYVEGRQVCVIHNGVAGPEHDRVRKRTAAPRIGCVGRIAPEKGQREFLTVAEKIHAVLPEAQFVIVGAALFSDFAAIEYERRVRDASAGMPVAFSGWATDVFQEMENLDLLLVPSMWQEPSPRVVLEAFAAGLPVIAFRVGGLPEIVENGRTGFLCDGVEEMAAIAIDLLQGDPARLCRVSQAARESWRARFTRERFQQQLLAAAEAAARPSR